MKGTNPILPPTHDDGKTLLVVEIFPTLQGEGPAVGTPAVFLRLGGCNLACQFCDTEFDQFTPIEIADIVEKIEQKSKNDMDQITHRLVVITGGEPFRQNIVPICNTLLERGFRVQIETNGTLYRDLDKRVEIVCSPKNTGHGYHKIRPDLLARIGAFKFIVSASDPLYQQVGDVGQDDYKIPVYVQPMDEYDADKNEKNKKLAAHLAEKHGYILSLQLHKILGIP